MSTTQEKQRHLIVRPIEDYVEQFENFVRYGEEMVKKEPRVSVMKEWYSDEDEDIEEKLSSLFTEVTAYIHSAQEGRSSRYATLAGFLAAFGFEESEAKAAAEGSLWVMGPGKKKKKKNKKKEETRHLLSDLTGCRSREVWSWKVCVLELFRPAAWT
ncbi:hypothetical protein AC579_7458 [Pseudocercospora musae]|uniref:Uncharacterized protein n=1 Tax=Pseudocercospora musae TaxID=113226 RepID=A0A139H7I6_9PEZI|nr:hypothetical protein AC579_7458 [Pseudocercospora musae]